MRNVIKGLTNPGSKKAKSRVRVGKVRPKQAPRAKTKRYVLVYDMPSDPPIEEVVQLKRGLKRVKVLDEMPGTVLVQGTPADVRKAVEPLQHWTSSPEGMFSA